MIFQTNTKPLNDALTLGIINSNVTNYDKRSNVVQLTMTTEKLIINIEASRIRTQIEVLGTGDAEYATIFVSSTMLKQLMSTITSPTVSLEFSDSGLNILLGRSKFTLAKMLDASEIELTAPEIPENYMDNAVSIDRSTWKYVKENQMYSIATSFSHPVYQNVWIGSGNDILVGDYDNSIFTYATVPTFGDQCLISPTILNLLISLPDGAKISKIDKSYLVFVTLNSFSYVTQFLPMYEGDDGIGSYNSDIFLGMMKHEDDGSISVNASDVTRYLAQAEMLNKETIPVIEFIVEDDCIRLKDRNVDCVVSINDNPEFKYSTKFKTALLKKLMSNYGDQMVHIKPLVDENNEVSGILVWDIVLTTVLACVVTV